MCTNLRVLNLCFKQGTRRILLSKRPHQIGNRTRTALKLYTTEPGTDAIPPPQFEEEEKVYSEKIRSIVEAISELTLIEVADLNDLLKRELKIQDTPMMMGAAMPMAAAGAPTESKEEETASESTKTSYGVQLTKYETGSKVKLIKEIKSLIPGLNLVQAKKFVESIPQIVKADLSKTEAEDLKKQLEVLGGTCTIE